MPTLLTNMPVSPAHMPVVHAAQTAGWKVIKSLGGRLETNLGNALAIYGAPEIVRAIARVNRISLFAPPANWPKHLPTEFQAPDARGSTADEGISFDLAPEQGGFESTVRCFVLDRMVVTLSPVSHQGKSCRVRGKWSAPEEVYDQALSFCEQLLGDSRVLMPPAFALDIGQMAGGDWCVIGGTAAWCAHIYSCSPAAILNVLLRSCKSASVSHEEAQWLDE
ncbi:MAG: ATP-grasp domain-containing protein [Pirellulaceae bacterium]